MEQNHLYNFSCSGFLKHIKGLICQAEQTPTVPLYDYTTNRLADRTLAVPLAQLLNTFTRGNGGRKFLYVANQTGIQFVRKSVSKLDSYNLRYIADGGSAMKTKLTREHAKVLDFFLAFEAKALSTAYVDNSGTATWVKLMRGRKIW